MLRMMSSNCATLRYSALHFAAVPGWTQGKSPNCFRIPRVILHAPFHVRVFSQHPEQRHGPERASTFPQMILQCSLECTLSSPPAQPASSAAETRLFGRSTLALPVLQEGWGYTIRPNRDWTPHPDIKPDCCAAMAPGVWQRQLVDGSQVPPFLSRAASRSLRRVRTGVVLGYAASR